MEKQQDIRQNGLAINIYGHNNIYIYIINMSLLGIVGLQITNGISVIQRVLRALHSCINNETVEQVIGVSSSDESLPDRVNEIGLHIGSQEDY